MSRVNNALRHQQLRKHYNHITDCGDHENINLSDLVNRINKLEQNGGSGAPCGCDEKWTEINEQIVNINALISALRSDVTVIQSDIAILQELISNSSSTGSEFVRISPAPAYGLDNLNTTYTSLLNEVAVMDEKALNTYFTNNIASVVDANDITAPIAVSAITSALCTNLFKGDKVAWDENLSADNKRAYIMQFILANPSNQTRALFVTNEMLKIIGVDCSSSATFSRGIDTGFDEDPAIVTPENASLRMRGCPYLME